MGRLPKRRRVVSTPQTTYFAPDGVSRGTVQEICLSIDEAEAIRLKDLETLEQERCARSMCVSRPTFARILGSARQKMADAILNGKAIRIEGGNFEMAMQAFRCSNGHEWDIPFEAMIAEPPQQCPTCRTPGIMPIQPPTSGWGSRRCGGGGW